MPTLESIIIDRINSAQRANKAQPLVLGGYKGINGGIGGPPGGFVGWLPQYRVAYDMTEDEIISSGASLLDNLNHIRYRLHLVELGTVISGFVPTFLDLDDTPDLYTGFAGTIVAVNSTEDGLVFQSPVTPGSLSFDIWQPDVAGDSPSSFTDEFNDDSIGVAWTQILPDDTKLVYSEGDLGLTMTQLDTVGGDGKIQGVIYETAPLADFSITVKVDGNATQQSVLGGGGSWASHGILVSNGLGVDYTTADSYFISWGYGSDGTRGPQFYVLSGFETVTSLPLNDTNNTYPEGIYLRVRYVLGTNTIFFDVSNNGISWINKYYRTCDFVPIEIGLATYADFSGTDMLTAYFQYFRVVEDASPSQINHGKRV